MKGVPNIPVLVLSSQFTVQSMLDHGPSLVTPWRDCPTLTASTRTSG